MARVVWVIQKLVNDKWFTCRDPNGSFMIFFTKCAAETKCRLLGDRYRVLRMED